MPNPIAAFTFFIAILESFLSCLFEITDAHPHTVVGRLLNFELDLIFKSVQRWLNYRHVVFTLIIFYHTVKCQITRYDQILLIVLFRVSLFRFQFDQFMLILWRKHVLTYQLCTFVFFFEFKSMSQLISQYSVKSDIALEII